MAISSIILNLQIAAKRDQESTIPIFVKSGWFISRLWKGWVSSGLPWKKMEPIMESEDGDAWYSRMITSSSSSPDGEIVEKSKEYRRCHPLSLLEQNFSPRYFPGCGDHQKLDLEKRTSSDLSPKPFLRWGQRYSAILFRLPLRWTTTCFLLKSNIEFVLLLNPRLFSCWPALSVRYVCPQYFQTHQGDYAPLQKLSAIKMMTKRGPTVTCWWRDQVTSRWI